MPNSPNSEGSPSSSTTSNASNTSPTTTNSPNSESVEGAKLFQNIPNPFSVNTEIRFEIPEVTNSAKLLIHDMQGAELQSYTINIRGSGSMIIQGSELPAGMYLYTLLINNVMIDTKKMILTK
jgi:hypothetical protein